MIEIEAKHRELLAALNAAQCLLHLLAKEHAVGQVGQRIVMRQIGDLRLGLAHLGDVLVGRDPAAVGHRLIGDAKRAAGWQFQNFRAGFSLAGIGLQALEEALGIVAAELAGGLAMLEYVEQRTALQIFRRQSHHLGVALVEERDAPLACRTCKVLGTCCAGRCRAGPSAPQFIFRLAIGERGNERHAEDCGCGAGDDEGERAGRQRQRVNHPRRIGNDFHRSIAVKCSDTIASVSRTAARNVPLMSLCRLATAERSAPEHNAEHDGGKNKVA